jgi:hypothetical protein
MEKGVNPGCLFFLSICCILGVFKEKRMEKTNNIYFSSLLLLLVLVVVLSGCQDIFTFSPFSDLGRDPSTLSEDQQINYATNALASGDPDKMAEAYDLIADLLEDDPDNGELHLLAAELAIGASGLGDIGSSVAGGDSDSYDDFLDGLDQDMLDKVAGHIEAAEDAGEDISDSQYVNAGTAIIASEAIDAGGFGEIDWDNPNENVQKGIDYAELGGVDIESMFNS